MTAVRQRKWKLPEYGGPLHRIAKPRGKRGGVVLAPDHPAIRESLTLFPGTVVHPDNSPRVLIDGVNQRKIGKAVQKGKWKGFPIFTLTLEERATCPASCKEWTRCYGNNMPRARRHIGGEAFERKLWRELEAKQAAHPRGFVVRLHILGDFYSAAYACLWGGGNSRIPCAARVRLYGARSGKRDRQHPFRPGQCRLGSVRHALFGCRPSLHGRRDDRPRCGYSSHRLPLPTRQGRLLRDLRALLAVGPHHRIPPALKENIHA